MDQIMGLINWFKDAENIKTVLAVFGALYTLLFTVVKLTPTPKDDELLSKVAEQFHRVAGWFGVKK